ncbi:YggU family protein [Legionella longbeachae]|uniref:DUF167 domain-containing protein n=1 Tax=Legionella longbeachae TaxID=450 RepID=UPI0009B75625|nr:DUF167 family protein [Legionella longbeachae]ARB92997.1 YggU family protein [Legionella longbeachae]RZV26649.1 YggU family protein [Legionella longbeachae]UAK47110.1 DUF167 family protein [Legionella longbeachae]VEE04169.1 Uncharacterised ACR, YggU family COG1872 [Legionella oakridgensis]
MEQQNHLPIPVWCKQKNNALILSLYIQPGAKCNQVIGVVGEELKIKIAAPSIEDKANVELVRYLASLFKVSKGQIKIKRGLKSRHKIIEIIDCGVDAVQRLVNV